MRSPRGQVGCRGARRSSHSTCPETASECGMFIDEGGTFVPWTGWAVVCLLALPHKEVGPTRREINRLSREWPRRDGELKGGVLQPPHLIVLVDVLFRHDALVHACAIDVSREDTEGIKRPAGAFVAIKRCSHSWPVFLTILEPLFHTSRLCLSIGHKSANSAATLPELGRNLRRVRTAAGLTQTQLEQ
jgi:hypothetical protein